MEGPKRGRRKSPNPIKEKRINFRVTEKELEHAQEVCIKNDIRYIHVFLKGLEYWSQKQ